MPFKLPALFFGTLLSFFCAQLFGQAELNLDSVQSISHHSYSYANGQEELVLVKESVFDTNQILILQNRYNYMKVDTGFAVQTHYRYSYNPKSKFGNYYTENLAHSSKPNKKYSKQESSFKSYDHKFKREWVKTYKKNSTLLLRQTEKTFDENGYVTSTKTTNYGNSPTSSSTEKVERNAAGNMVRWESFDDDGDTKMQARSFEATYKNDTLLVYSSGYLYHNWNEVSNKYNGKNELKKTILTTGTRRSTGTINRDDQTIITYKNGKPFKSVEKKLGKVVKKISYLYEPGKEIQKITTPKKSYTEVKTYTYLDSAQRLLTEYTETLEGKPFLKKELEYDTLSFKIKTYTEIEYRNNGKDWKTVKTYNDRGNLTKTSFYIADKLNKEDRYEYTYQPPKPKPEEEEEKD